MGAALPVIRPFGLAPKAGKISWSSSAARSAICSYNSAMFSIVPLSSGNMLALARHLTAFLSQYPAVRTFRSCIVGASSNRAGPSASYCSSQFRICRNDSASSRSNSTDILKWRSPGVWRKSLWCSQTEDRHCKKKQQRTVMLVARTRHCFRPRIVLF